MKRYLITGGAGFIGSNMCQRLLLDEQNEVIAFDDLTTGTTSNFDAIKDNPRFRFVQGDVVTIDQDGFDSLDVIYHFACPASPPKYQLDPIQTLNTSYVGTQNLLKLALKHEATMLFSSTSEVYGDPEISPQPETYRGSVNTVGPRACYDEGKRVAETLCYEYQRKYDMDVKIFRIFNTYGPLMDPLDGRVVTNFINQALEHQPLSIYGTGNQSRSFQYIDDLIEGIIRLTDVKGFYGPINLGNPYEFTILELAQKVVGLIPDSSSQLVYHDLPQDDPTQRRPDISLAKKLIDWEPQIQLNEGLTKTIEYFKSLKTANS